jgi:hypothetical protein
MSLRKRLEHPNLKRAVIELSTQTYRPVSTQKQTFAFAGIAMGLSVL